MPRPDLRSAETVPVAAGRATEARRQAGWDPAMVGTCLGLVSAVGYTATNIALREAARPGEVDWALWVSCLKAVPSALAAWGLIALRAWRGRPALPPRGLWLPLVLTGLLMQFGGNGLFQWSLSVVGLAVVVPLTFATLIASGALLGWMALGEPITARSAVAMGVLIASIVVLSVGAGNGALPQGATVLETAAAVGAACVSGLAYGTSGVVIRRTVTRHASLSAVLMVLSTTGAIGLGAASLLTLGPRRIVETPTGDLAAMWAAGVFNAVAFFAVSGALQRIPVVRTNLLNSSQIAMCAAAGVLIFDESWNVWLALGILLTITGLALMERSRARRIYSK